MAPSLPFLLPFLLLAANAQQTPTPLVTVHVPVEIDSNSHYLASVNMSTGPNPQFFKFALASNTGYTIVAGDSCTTCGGVPSYNATASTTEQTLAGRTQDVTFGSSTGSGFVIKENCGLFETNGSYWQYPNQTIVVANTSSAFSGSTSGIIGLGTNNNGDGANDFFDTVFGGWMIRNPTHNNFSFGLALNPLDGQSTDGGIIHWVVPDTSFAKGQISFKDIQPTNSTPGIGADNTSQNSNGISTVVPQGDWAVQLDGWALSAGGTQIGNSTPSTAIVEVFYPNIYFPLQQAHLLYAGISGSQLLPDLVDDFQVWSIPCDSQFSVAFNFGQVFSLDQSTLMVKNGSTCTGVIQGFPDTNEQFFLFGSRFVSQLYIIFVVGRPGSSTPSQIGFGNRATKKSKPIGAIVGGTVGGVAGLALIALGVFLFMRYRRRRSSIPVQNNNTPPSHPDDESKAQYITYTGSSMYGSLAGSPSPPSTAGLYRPLLPEPQSPEAPQFNIPRATLSSFAPASAELQSSYTPYQYMPQAPVVTSADGRQATLLVSPQNSPLSHQFNHQEIMNDQVYRNMHPLDSTITSPSGTGYTIEPFQMPTSTSSAQPESRPDSKSALRPSNPSESDTNPPPPAYVAAETALSTTLVGASSNAPTPPSEQQHST